MDHKVDSELYILAGKAKLLFSNGYAAGLANIGAALALYLLVMQSSIAGAAAPWFVTLAFISLVRMGLSIRFNKDFTRREIQRYLKLYFVTVLLLGVCWGYASVLQYQLGNPDVRNFVILVYLGLVAASISTMSAWLPAVIAFASPQLIIIVGVMVLEEEIVSYYTGLALFVYTLLMLVLAKNISSRVADALSLKRINLKLINELSDEVEQRKEAQRELESHQVELEKAVKERTHELLDINDNLQREIDDRRQAEQNLQYAEQYDKLTGLPNRELLLDRIKHAVSTTAREQRMVAVLFLGIDRFKKINDSFGHAVGDNLLQQVANKLKLLLREGDTVARNGGDEFVVVLERIDKANIAEVVARKVIASLDDTFTIVGHDLHIGVSIGIAISPFDGDEPQQLLESADTAMHRAKQQGGNSFEFYAEGMSHEIRERLNMETGSVSRQIWVNCSWFISRRSTP